MDSHKDMAEQIPDTN